MSEFESKVHITIDEPEILWNRIVAQWGLKNRALERASKAEPGDGKDRELKKAEEHELGMNSLLDHWPDGKPRDIRYLAIAEDEIVEKLSEALDEA